MTKVQVTCATCGFIGFLESFFLAEASGWLKASEKDGEPVWCCPACREDDVCDADNTEAPRTQTQGR